ncbi:sugar porter family MFS transporter [Xylanibacter muris]|uniref:Sugar porter family MFS transporter n=1 Tax=Xylanibacter muris TaxID=2736290 RepID=A0ABX2AKN4_9BACT|nr:sugar porter family MFS transporter [Xylanibacter muris]NPD91320.1 sugar porter family MFS transporter [Xylanibacter muris]
MNVFNKNFTYFICMVSAMGGLLFGYDWVVIGGAKPFYELYFEIADSPVAQGLAMTIALIGCMLGAMMCGFLADRIGRKRLLVVSAFIFLFSSVGTGAFSSFVPFLIARFFGGIGIGVASGLSPMYIAEVAPSHVRGKLVSLNQMTIVLGILGAQITNWLIADDIPAGYGDADILLSWNGQMAWRWMFWAAAVPSALFLVLAFFIPESPRWLAMKSRESDARDVLMRIGGNEYADAELGAVRAANINDAGRCGLRMLFRKPFRKVLLVGVVIAVFQQWCGTNVIFNYAQEIFQSAGYEIGDVLFNIVITGVTNVIFTIVAIFTVDRLGRRMLMLFGAGGLCGIYLTLGACYYFHITGITTVVMVMAAIACYAMTLGPCTWVLISELFPNNVRAVAVATCTLALWIGSSTLTFTFPFLNASLGSYGTFWIYSGVCMAGFIFFIIRLPETKGKSLENLQKELIDK